MLERKVWFITRPERDPKFHVEALRALREATNDFCIQWVGNRNAHLEYERCLNRIGVKRENVSRDGSGGRTWCAMLKTFAYCYTTDDGYIVPTYAGVALLKGEKVFQNIKKQILTFQIPNAYFLESGFRPKFENGFRIRPARFLIRLTNQVELDWYITKEEITYFSLTTKDDNQLVEVTQNIIKFRCASSLERNEIKQQIAEEYDHRERSDRGARDYEKAHGDVAHTFMLICAYTGLVEYIRGDALRVTTSNNSEVNNQEINFFDIRYPFNNRFYSLQRLAETNGLDVDRYKASQMWGAGPATNKKKTQITIKRILKSTVNPGLLTTEELIEKFANEFSPSEAERLAYQIKESNLDFLNLDFVEEYLNVEDNLVFENMTGDIFRAIGFEVVMRPKPVANVRTEIEILLKYGQKEFGIIDCKNYKTKFLLPANYASHMALEYLPNYEDYEGRNVSFFGYVTASDFGGEKNLEKITRNAEKLMGREINGIMINASSLLGFLDFCIQEDLDKENRIELFLKLIVNEGYSTIGKVLKILGQTN